MTEENKKLRDVLREVDVTATQFMHSQPENDDECKNHLIRALSRIAEITKDYYRFMEVEVFDIEWDTDGEEVDLPKSCRLLVDRTQDFYDTLADRISDRFGWCVKGFKFRRM